MIKNKKIVIRMMIYLNLISMRSLKAVEPVTVVVTSAVGLGVKEAGEVLKDYWFRSEEADKRIIRKHLNSRLYQSAVAQGCNEHFIEQCHLYAAYLRKMEEYNAVAYEGILAQYQKGNIVQTSEDSTSYFATLSEEEKQQVLKLERELVTEYANPREYKQELQCVYDGLNAKY